jgi:serine/threonine-protein kinase
MAPDAARLLALADAVAEGKAVDWAEAESTSVTHEDRELVRQLQLLAGVADVHRAGLQPAADERVGKNWGALHIKERIGGGTFGAVYRAHDPRLARDVALKLLHYDASRDRASAAIEEGRLLARVRDPHVITVYGADRHEGTVGVWMELISGRTLEDVLRNDGPFGAREAALIGIDLCSALAAVHAQGLVHRDIKAQNVMREDGGRIVLMDFGAGQEGHTGAAAPSVGTPVYMAPEVLDGSPATPATDLYSLGVLLFRLVTGQYPFPTTSANAVVEAQRAHRGKRLRDLRPQLPRDFVAIVDRALSSDPAARFQTAAEMEDALTGTLHRTGGTGRPRTAVTIAVAAVLVVATLALAGWYYRPVAPGALEVIGVRPLENISSDPNQRYLSVGMTDVILAALDGLEGRKIIRLPATSAYDTRADAIVEGSVAGSPERVQVIARLVRAGTGELLWSRTYEKTLADIGPLESQIGKDLGDRILGKTSTDQRPAAHIARASAQEAYFRGWAEIEGYSRPTAVEAIRWFELAVKEDPAYALAHAALSHAYYTAGVTFKLYPRTEAHQLAKNAALQSLRLDPNLSRGLATLGQVQMNFEWDWTAAEQNLRQAVVESPNDGRIRYHYASLLAATGRTTAALKEIREASELDPGSVAARLGLGVNLYYARRYRESIAAFEDLLREDPNLRAAFVGLAKSLNMVGDYQKAIDTIELARFRDEPAPLVDVARAEALRGNRSEARRLISILEARAAQGDVAREYVAAAWLALGDRERALDLLEVAVDERSPTVIWLQVDPRFDALRTDLRFATLLRRIGFER